MVGVFLPVIIFVSYTGWKIERIKIALQKQYAAYQKSDEKQKMEKDIAKKRQKLNEQSASLKNTKIKTFKELPMMSLKQRKKNLSSIEMSEKFLINQAEKLDLSEELVNQPLNEEISVNDPEMMHYFPRIKVYYFVMVLIRTFIEIGFDYIFYLLYQDNFFNIMPEQFICTVGLPCNGDVSCYIDRPKQKTAMLIGMMAFSIVTIITGFVELWSIGLGEMYEAMTKWSVDITQEYRVAKTEQMFHSEKHTSGGFVNFQGTRVDHMRDEIGDDEDNQFIGI
jgi:hypothetical protein